MQSFGFAVSPEMVSIEARVLKPPSVVYQRSHPSSSPNVTPCNGKWNLQRRKLVTPEHLGLWSVVVFHASHFDPTQSLRQVRNFIRKLVDVCKNAGMVVILFVVKKS
jgi:hypothetical protein